MDKRRIKLGANEDKIWIKSGKIRYFFWIIRHGQACCMMQSGVVTFSWVHTAVQHTDYGHKAFRFLLKSNYTYSPHERILVPGKNSVMQKSH